MPSRSAPVDLLQHAVGELDTRLFGENTISTRLLKSYILMGVLVFILPPLLDTLLNVVGLKAIFFYLSLPALVFLIIILFVYWSIKKLLHPIRELLVAVRRIEVGELDVHLDLKGYLEIEKLANAVERMRNSLLIAKKYLGERESVREKSFLDIAISFNLTLILFVSYLIYGMSMIAIGGLLYSSVVQDQLAFLPFYKVVTAVLVVVVGLVLAIGVGYILSVFIGTPMRALTIAAEKASKGDFDADFTVIRKGELQEIAHHLGHMTSTLKKAYAELEREEG